MDCKLVKQNIPRFLDNELPARDLQELQNHVKSCLECANEIKVYNALIRESAKLEQKQAPEYLWQKIAADLQEQSQPFWQRLLAEIALGLKTGLKIPAPVFRIAAATAILFVGIFLGRYLLPVFEQEPVQIVSKHQNEKYKSVSQRTLQYVEKSKILFLGVINADAHDIRNADWSTEQGLAASLVQEAAFLKDSLSDKRNVRLKILVEELELILLEIANMEGKQDLENIELIKSGIDQKALMLKINLFDLAETDATAKRGSL